MRCGKPSSQQWQICSLNNKWVGVCVDCDVKFNQIVLTFMGVRPKDVYTLIEEYKKRKK